MNRLKTFSIDFQSDLKNKSFKDYYQTKPMILRLLLILFIGLMLSGHMTSMIHAQDTEDFDVIFEDEEDEDSEEPAIAYPMPEKREALTPEQFIAIVNANSAILLDVRGKAEMKFGYIKNSLNIPLYVLETEHKKLPRDEPIVIFCDNGMRALFAYDLLWAKGFKNIKFLNYSVAFKPSGAYKILGYHTK